MWLKEHPISLHPLLRLLVFTELTAPHVSERLPTHALSYSSPENRT